MQKNILYLRETKSEKNVIKYSYKVEGDWSRIFTDDKFEIQYSHSLAKCSQGVENIPFVCNILPIAWLYDAEIVLNALDEDFYRCIPDLRNGYVNMYPMLHFAKDVVKVKKLIPAEQSSEEKRVGCLFSGGVDAFSTMIAHYEEKPILFTLWGSDVDVSNEKGWEMVDKHIREVSQIYGLEYVYIQSSFRKMIDEMILNLEIGKIARDDWWHGFQHGIAILSHIAPLTGVFGLDKLYIASSFTKEDQGVTCASDPTIDNYMRFNGCKVIHDGYENNRQMKIHSICQFHKRTGMPVEVRVCYETDQGNNCCHCEKCTRTMLGIMAEGEDPRNYGFFCSNEELKEMEKNFENIAYGQAFPNRIWRQKTYEQIQRAFKRNHTKETVPEGLRWFWDYDCEKLNITKDRDVYTQMFFDMGNGVSEKDSVRYYCKMNKLNRWRVHIPQGVSVLRFDPCNMCCECEIVEVKYNGQSLQTHMKPINGIKTEKKTMFLTNDPQYVLTVPEGKEPAVLDIIFYCRELEKEEIIQRFEQILADEVGKRKEAENRAVSFETLYNSAINSVSWKITRPLRTLSATLNGGK